MKQLIERCAGPDVHKVSVTACVRVPGDAERREEVATFLDDHAGPLDLAIGSRASA
jgi:hypothetical protein